jgi:hypothetical protein
MYYYRYFWNETRGDMFDHWGTSVWYAEVGSDRYVTRQLEVYRSGIILAYDEEHHNDIYGILSDAPFEIDSPIASIDEKEFNVYWNQTHYNKNANIINKNTLVHSKGKPHFSLSGTRCRSFPDFVAEINATLFYHHPWQGNLDALNDMLAGGFGTPEQGFILEWNDSLLASTYLGFRETIRLLEQRLETCHPANTERVRQDIRRAAEQRGTTIFDWMVDIFVSHVDITLILA